MNGTPLVSVIIPTYNREKTLPRAIESVLNQTYTNWEIIISDDGSSDNTEALINKYSAANPRVRYVSRGKNGGPGAARNFGIKNAKGKYIAFLDSDDQWTSRHLSESINILESEKVDATIALWRENRAGQLFEIDAPYEGTDYFKLAIEGLRPVIKDKYYFMPSSFFKYVLLEYFYFINVNTLVMKREVLKTSGMFDESLRLCEDTDFLLKIFLEYKICMIKDYHFTYNHGTDNIYAFIDRTDIDLQALSRDSETTARLTDAEMYKIKLRKLWLKRVKDKKHIEDRRECTEGLKKYMADKYFTLGYINREVDKLRAINYYIKSAIYGFSPGKAVFIGRLLLPFVFNRVKIERPTLNFW